MIVANQVSVPSNGNPVTIFQNQPVNESQISIRNTGAVTVLLGGADGNLLFPLGANEYLGVVVTHDDTLQAKVANNGVPGQLTILAS